MAAGHSAGAAILVRMCLDGQIAPQGLVSLNGAMLPLGGSAGQLFSPLAKLLAGLPLLPDLFAWRARDPGRGGAPARRHRLDSSMRRASALYARAGARRRAMLARRSR